MVIIKHCTSCNGQLFRIEDSTKYVYMQCAGCYGTIFKYEKKKKHGWFVQ